MIYVADKPDAWWIAEAEGRMCLFLRGEQTAQGWEVYRVEIHGADRVRKDMETCPRQWTYLLLPQYIQVAEQTVRRQRNQKLADTDYLMRPDYPITDADKAEVIAYSQALRDVPEQDGYPYDVRWPELPDILKRQIKEGGMM